MTLNEIFVQSQTDRKIWLNMIKYSNQIFANGSDDLWSAPTNFISIYSQGQDLLGSDVLSIPVKEIYQHFLKDKGHITDEWIDQDPVSLIEEILSFEEPKQFLSDVLEGLHNLFTGTLPLVVDVPSPQGWLKWINEFTNPQQDQEIPVTEDEIEFASMFLADYLRHFSTINISAIVLIEENPKIELEKSLPLYQPILNVIEHFQWVPGLKVEKESVNLAVTKNKFNFVLQENSNPDELETYWINNDYVCGGLNEDFWMDNSGVTFPSYGFMYGEIPYNSNPEKVLNKIKFLRNDK